VSTFLLPMPPSANGLWANSKSGGRFRTQNYEDWIHEAGWELKRQRPLKVAGPVQLLYEFQEASDRRKRDLGNLEKATTDLLVSHGIIEADDNTIVRGIRLKWDAEVKGVRITVEKCSHRVPESQKGDAEKV
jgi:crossover junction endodeoxyribonuclease RusA